MRILAFLLLLAIPALLAASPAHARPDPIFPGLVDVVGVAADDALNIRAAPNARAPIIGTLPHDATAIEVIEARAGWLRVNRSGVSGWVNGRFAQMRPGIWQDDALPAGLICHGVEPFWSLSLNEGAALFTTPQSIHHHGDARVLGPEFGVESPRRAILAQDLVAVIAPALCSDGMSDATFGLEVDLVLGTRANARYLRGCCSIAP